MRPLRQTTHSGAARPRAQWALVLWMVAIVSARAEIVGRWNSSGAVPLAGTFAPVEAHACASVGSLVASSNLLRTGASPSVNTFAAAGYSGVDSNAAMVEGHYWETVIQAQNGHAISHESIVYRFRRTSLGPIWAQWAYSLDGSVWTWLSPPGSNSTGYLDKELVLDSISALQSAEGPVWFRLYAWGGSASSTAWGVFGLNTNVLTFNGLVEQTGPLVIFIPSGGQTVGVSNALILAVSTTPQGSGVHSWNLAPSQEGEASLTNGRFYYVPAPADEGKEFLLSVVATNAMGVATGTVSIAVTPHVTQYAIGIAPTVNGTVHTMPIGMAAAGQTVSILATADEGYRIADIEVVDGNANPLVLTNHSFEMPAQAVTVTVEFEAYVAPDTLIDFETDTDSISAYAARTSMVNSISFIHLGMLRGQTTLDQKHGNFSARFRHQEGIRAFFRNEASFDQPIAKLCFWHGNYGSDDLATFQVQASTDGTAWVDVGPVFNPEGKAFVEAMLDDIPANSHYFKIVSVSGADHRINVDDIGLYWGEPVLTLGMDRTNGFGVGQGTEAVIAALAGFGTEPYSYSWTSTLEAAHCDANANELAILSTAPPGEYSATVVAQDADLRSATNTISFRVLPAYAITIAPPTDGAVATVPPGAAVEGESILILATPDAGYAVGSISVVDSASQPVELAGLAFAMPASAVTVAVSFAPMHAIEIMPAENGTVTTTPGSEAEEGATVTLHAVANVGYQSESIMVRDAELNPVPVVDGTFTMPATNVTITAVFGLLPPIAEPGALRVQNFNNWTGSVFETDGLHVKDGWMVQNASIASTSGAFATPAVRLSPTNSAIVSPRFADGVGQVAFWARTWDAGAAAHMSMQSSIDGGSTWSNCASFSVSSATVHSVWLHIPSSDAAVRLVFDPGQSSQDVLIDNVDICVPTPYLIQNFDEWPVKSAYNAGTDRHRGWAVSNCVVNDMYAYNGQAARLNSSIGSYIQSPELSGGIGEINFLVRKWADVDPAFSLDIQVSPDGASWQAVTNLAATTTEYRRVSFYLGDASHRFVRLANGTGSARILIDDIRISALQPRPEVEVVPGFDPPMPLADQPVSLLAQVRPLNGAEVLSVTGCFRIGTGAWSGVPLSPAGDGFYAAPDVVSGQPFNSMLRSYVQVQFAGAGAVPESIGYATNWVTSATLTNLYGTQAFSRVMVQGSFIGTNEPAFNMTRIENTALWESEQPIAATSDVSLRFVTDLEDVFWGAEEGAPVLPLPASGLLIGGSTNYARVAVEENGQYIVRFNHLTGEFSFRRSGIDDYYAQAQGLSGINLRQALRDVISTANILPDETLHSVFAQTDARSDGTVWDMYSDNPGGVRPYEYMFDECSQCGTSQGEGDCYQIGRAWPSSWFGGAGPMVSDVFMTFPLDGRVNQMRSARPLGEVVQPTTVFLNGSKRGMCSTPGYSDAAFEPIDEYKGDFARAFFYASTRHFVRDAGWQANPAVTGADLNPWLADMLVRWHEDDPVSVKEVARNEAVYAVQRNRNPFIDHPEWVPAIWGNATNRELPSLRVVSPAALLTSVDEESLTVRGCVSVWTTGHLTWSNQTTRVSGTFALDGTNFVLSDLSLGHGQNLIHLVASNATGQTVGRSLSVFRHTGARTTFDVDANWQGVPDCSESGYGALQYRPADSTDPDGFFEGMQVARVKGAGMDIPGYAWRLASDVADAMVRYRTPLSVARFSVFLAPDVDSMALGFEIYASTNSGESYEILFSADATWFEGAGRFKPYESPPLDLCPTPGQEVFIEIRRTTGWEIFVDDFDYVAALDLGDLDADGLPDAWEVEYFSNVTTVDGAGDFDEDRLTNAEECPLGTNPTLRDTDEDGQSDGDEFIAGTGALNPWDRFAFDEIGDDAGGSNALVLNWNTVVGRVYRLFRSTSADGDWNGAVLLLDSYGDGQRQQFTNDSSHQTGFFRLTVENP